MCLAAAVLWHRMGLQILFWPGRVSPVSAYVIWVEVGHAGGAMLGGVENIPNFII